MLGGTRGGRTCPCRVRVRCWELEYRIQDALNLSTDDARRRHVAIDDAVEKAGILIALLKVATARGEGTLLNSYAEFGGGVLGTNQGPPRPPRADSDIHSRQQAPERYLRQEGQFRYSPQT